MSPVLIAALSLILIEAPQDNSKACPLFVTTNKSTIAQTLSTIISLSKSSAPSKLHVPSLRSVEKLLTKPLLVAPYRLMIDALEDAATVLRHINTTTTSPEALDALVQQLNHCCMLFDGTHLVLELPLKLNATITPRHTK